MSVSQSVSRQDLTDSRWRAIILICALQVLDLATTYAAIKWAGAEEGNPMAKWLVDTYMIFFAKIAVCGAIVWFAFQRTATVRTATAAWFCVGTYVLAVVLNFSHLVSAAV